jgi:hypothetical protein
VWGDGYGANAASVGVWFKKPRALTKLRRAPIRANGSYSAPTNEFGEYIHLEKAQSTGQQALNDASLLGTSVSKLKVVVALALRLFRAQWFTSGKIRHRWGYLNVIERTPHDDLCAGALAHN